MHISMLLAFASPAAACPLLVLAPSLLKIRNHVSWCGTTPPRLQLASARNEYESFQVVLNAPTETVISVDVHFSGMSEGIAELNANVLVHHVAHIHVTIPSDCDGATGEWPDALIPLRDPWFGEPRTAPPLSSIRENVVLWVDLFVPPEVPAGNYTANVTVTSHVQGGRQTTRSASLNLRVFGFLLHSTNPWYKTSYGLSTKGILMAAYGRNWRQHINESVNLTQRYMDLGLMHGLSLTHGGIQDPVLESSPVDWNSFNDRWDEYVLGKDMPFGVKSAAFTSVEAPSSPSLNALFHANAKKRGWANKLVTKVCDEPANAQGWATCNSSCSAVHAANGDARCEVTSTFEQLHENSNGTMKASDVGVFTALVNFMENSAQHCPGWPSWSFRNSRGDYTAWQAGGAHRELWMYQSCMSEGCSSGINKSDGCAGVTCDSGWPSLMIDAPAIMNRIFPVLGYHYNASGELYWHTNYADTCARENYFGNCPVDELPSNAWAMDPWKSQLIQGGNGDGQLTYPGLPSILGGSTFIPIASIRLKQLRDGMEDNQYLHLLEIAYGRENAMQLLSGMVTNAFTYTRDVQLYARIREHMGHLIELAAKDSKSTDVRWRPDQFYV